MPVLLYPCGEMLYLVRLTRVVWWFWRCPACSYMSCPMSLVRISLRSGWRHSPDSWCPNGQAARCLSTGGRSEFKKKKKGSCFEGYFRWAKSCCTLTLLHTPVQLSQDVVKQDVVEGLEVLGEDIADGIKCVVAGGGHPLCFLRTQNHLG